MTYEVENMTSDYSLSFSEPKMTRLTFCTPGGTEIVTFFGNGQTCIGEKFEDNADAAARAFWDAVRVVAGNKP